METEKILYLILIALLSLYSSKLYFDNKSLSTAIKKLSKSTNKANTSNFIKIQNLSNELEFSRQRYESIVIINAIVVSASVHTIAGHMHDKCTFENSNLREIEILNVYHSRGEFSKVFDIMKRYELDPAEGVIPFGKLLRLFEGTAEEFRKEQAKKEQAERDYWRRKQFSKNPF